MTLEPGEFIRRVRRLSTSTPPLRQGVIGRVKKLKTRRLVERDAIASLFAGPVRHRPASETLHNTGGGAGHPWRGLADV